MAEAQEDAQLLVGKMERSTDDLSPRSNVSHEPQQPHTQRVTGALVYSICAAVLGMFQFGYNTAVINSPQNVIKAFYNETYIERYDRIPEDDTISLLWATTVAIFAVGGMFGGLLGGWWAERFGRKKGMLLNTFIGILAGALMGFSELAGSFEMVIIGRIIVGFNCGLYTGLAPLYNSEISPIQYRGAIGTVNQLAVTIAMLIAQVFGLQEIMGTETLWPLLLGLTVLPPLLQLAMLPFAPESPRYLLLEKGKEDDAYRALVQLRGTEDVQWEMDEMISEGAAASNEKSYSMWELLKSSSLRMPLLVAIMMHLSQQLSGINCIFYYSTSLFVSVGLDEDEATYATTSVGGIMVVMTLVSIPLMDRAGRRTLHLVGLGGMFVFSIVFTISFEFASRNGEEWLEYFAIISALVIVVFFAIGPGSIPWMIVAELFSQGPRAAAVNIGVLTNWLANFVVGLSFPAMQEGLQELVFVPYTVCLAIFFCLLFKTLPETKGKTFEEISAIFNKGKRTIGPTEKEDHDLGLDGKYASFGETAGGGVVNGAHNVEKESSMDES